MLNLKLNFLKIYSTNLCDFMLEILFRTSLFFWYIKILLRSFSFRDIENVKPKFQTRYAYKLYAYIKKSVWNVKKGNSLLQKLNFETLLLQSFISVRQDIFRKITWKLNYLTLIDADRMDALKWHSKLQSKMVILSVKQLLNSVKNNSIFWTAHIVPRGGKKYFSNSLKP